MEVNFGGEIFGKFTEKTHLAKESLANFLTLNKNDVTLLVV